jgi:hypothetical protein
MEEIASCEVQYGVPVNDGKKITQLMHLGGNKYGTVITLTQMCKKTKM